MTRIDWQEGARQAEELQRRAVVHLGAGGGSACGLVLWLSRGAPTPRTKSSAKLRLFGAALAGEVRVNEESLGGRVLWLCARDGGRLLDALAPAALFLGQCAHDSTLSENGGLRQANAQECALAAGGSDYLDFYRVLLGCE